MAVIAYLDKSGQNTSKYVTLAAFAGPDTVWAEFEYGWNQILKTGFLPVDYMHMVEAVGLRYKTPFSRSLGWTKEHVWKLTSKLLIYMQNFKNGRITMHSCVIDMDAWHELTSWGCEIPSEIELCNRYVSEYIVAMLAKKLVDETPGEEIILHKNDLMNFTFDQNEDFFIPFLNFVNEEKRKTKTSGEFSMWNLVDGIGEGDMRNTPGIQAADVLAWGLNRENTSNANDGLAQIAEILRQVVMSTSKEYDRETLFKEFGPPLPNAYL